MKKVFNLSKSTLVFYSFISPFIIVASFYNLVYGIILKENSTVNIGFFSILGFLAMPILLVSVYVRNKLTITNQNVTVHKVDFLRSEHHFAIVNRTLAKKDRPIFSLFREVYHTLVITKKSTGEIVFHQDLQTSQKYAEKIKTALQNS